MDVNDRIRLIVKSGITMKAISNLADVSYYKVSSVVNPKKYKGEASFDKYETERINIALDTILDTANKAVNL